MSLFLFLFIFVISMAIYEVLPHNFWLATLLSWIAGLWIAVITGALNVGGVL